VGVPKKTHQVFLGMYYAPGCLNLGLMSQKLNHLSSSVCRCIVLLERVTFKLFPQAQCTRTQSLWVLVGAATSTVCHQWTRWV